MAQVHAISHYTLVSLGLGNSKYGVWPLLRPDLHSLGLGGGSRLTGVLVLQHAEFRDMVSTVSTTHSRSRELILDSLFWSKLST